MINLLGFRVPFEVRWSWGGSDFQLDACAREPITVARPHRNFTGFQPHEDASAA